MRPRSSCYATYAKQVVHQLLPPPLPPPHNHYGSLLMWGRTTLMEVVVGVWGLLHSQLPPHILQLLLIVLGRLVVGHPLWREGGVVMMTGLSPVVWGRVGLDLQRPLNLAVDHPLCTPPHHSIYHHNQMLLRLGVSRQSLPRNNNLN
eukprot:GFYU01036624.1.p2 GENE.GFYU01036624.1~~GFYU01036624.1.p2  ORF type:complete len:147 (+),score=1.33 GFYU01036624.1:50-490(+)